MFSEVYWFGLIWGPHAVDSGLISGSVFKDHSISEANGIRVIACHVRQKSLILVLSLQL